MTKNDDKKRNRTTRNESYRPKWMSGADALEYMKGGSENPRDCFRLLQAAVKDGAITGRQRGREKEREFFVRNGLALNEDYVEQVDIGWRNKFILVEPESVEINEFSQQSELLSEHVLKQFRGQGGSGRSQSKRIYSEKALKSFVSDYIKGETSDGRMPTLSRLEKTAGGKRFGRDSLRAEFKEQQQAAGFDVQRGRPPKLKA